jgi:serine/threonine protein kinase
LNLDIGTVIDNRYKITGTVGQGGMATVYLVTHTTLSSVHALKVLHLTTQSIRNRLIQ